MKNIILFIVIIAVAAYVFLIIKKNRESTEPEYIEKPVILNPQVEKPQQQTPAVKYPLPESDPEPEPVAIPEPEPLPALDDSDNVILEGITSVSEKFQWQDLFLFESIVRNFVVTVDNMTAVKLPRKYRFVRPLAGKYMVSKGSGESLFVNPDNFSRYEPYIRLAETVNLEDLVALYRRYYPLFQQAYEELGYPDRYFNDRFVEVIDHMLAAPVIDGQIELKQPKVYYVFADPQLEGLSAGQKIMLRMGRDNDARIRARLRQLRSLLTGT